MVKTEYLERDLGCSAYLVTIGYKLLGLEKLDEGFYAFRFDDPLTSADRDSRAFSSGAVASADKLLQNLRKLKSMLRAEKFQKNGAVKNGTARRSIR